MKHILQQQMISYRKWRKEVLLFGFPDLLLIIVVLGLIIMMVAVCIKSTGGSSSITALKNYLNALQSKFTGLSAIDAEAERAELERLLINVKSNCDKEVISGNAELKTMFGNTCRQVKSVTDSKEAGNRSSWQKLKDVTTGFDEFYFPVVI
jgi:hypothetical protein